MTNSPCPDCTHPIGATIGHTHNDSQSRRHRAPDGRTTAEIIADLRVAAVVGPRSDTERWLIRDAADRLAKLLALIDEKDAEIARLTRTSR